MPYHTRLREVHKTKFVLIGEMCRSLDVPSPARPSLVSPSLSPSSSSLTSCLCASRRSLNLLACANMPEVGFLPGFGGSTFVILLTAVLQTHVRWPTWDPRRSTFNCAADLLIFQHKSHSFPPFCLGAVQPVMLPLISLAKMQNLNIGRSGPHCPCQRSILPPRSSCWSI